MKKLVVFLSVLCMMLTFSVPTFAKAGEDHLNYGEGLSKGQSLVSKNGLYTLAMQFDGNLVLYGRGTALWDTHTYGNPHVTEARLVYSGYFGLLGDDRDFYWTSNNRDYVPGILLVLQDDGNLVLYSKYDSTYFPVWDTNTYIH
ncbi:lectin [Paenibacillus sp. SYP-B3998]|uniref:Lectin n=1 Tax=Paenibacillus sp. SYP-B3998 TaxID=2678564 RepID=A0A6G3ZSZ8_9BACL|nr:lectin [Paenibacillus sp. SYP-B3998]NEW05333.1 lectin [Paenibacillus sp. SYP-B3998]